MYLLKDARSVSLHPYNRSQILQYVKYSKKINIAKQNCKFCDKKCAFGQTSKITTTAKQKNQTLKPLPEPGIEPGTSRIQSRWVTSTPPSQLRE